MQKLLKGSFIILIGTIIFRIGGYLYVVIAQSLLGIEGFGILSLVMSFQWILILIAVAGLPPAIAKYVGISVGTAWNMENMKRRSDLKDFVE